MFYSYLIEIKNRLVILLLTWVTSTLACYYNKEILLFKSIKPCINTSQNTFMYFISTDLTEIFTVYVQLSYFVSNQILIVYLLFHLLMFILPALYKTEQNSFKFVFILYFLQFWFTIWATLNLVIPFCWNFFTKFQNQTNHNEIKLHFETKLVEYLNFSISVYYLCFLLNLTFIALFVIFDLIKFKVTFIKSFRKLFYFFFLLIATFITPPDIISQILVGGGFFFFFEAIVITVILKEKLIN